MIRSMTGYGRAAGAGELIVEISSVNRKNLDVAVSLPREWQQLEPEIGAAVKRRVSRGRVNVSVSTDTPGEEGASLFNASEVESALRELAVLSEKHGIPFEPDLNLLFNLASSIRSRPGLTEAEAVREELLRAVEEALEEMAGMRAKEGEALRNDLAERKKHLVDRLQKIRKEGANVVPDYRETLLKRLRQSGLEFSLEDDRVLKEIALFADRCDISEELTRQESHLAQFDEFLESPEPVGRKFEFLIQEIGREFNTIGSKANDSTISRLVIDCKNELERIREQVANVE